MMTRLRLILLLARPAVILLLVMFAAVGLGQAGHPQDPVLVAKALAAIAGFLLFSVACNDLADEQIDRVNLPGRRPLSAGLLGRREFTVIGVVAGIVSLAASATIGWLAVLVTAGGLCVSAGYSLRPVRLADRGAVASVVLPACYVAVPYLLGVLAGGGGSAVVQRGTLLLLAGLYLGFIGRILLKDFRDVRGDTLFGKRTFLVRHGRRWTCVFSACCWTGGTVLIVVAARGSLQLWCGESACAALALALLAALAGNRGARNRRDEAIVAALAIVGRGMVVLLLAYQSMMLRHWSPVAQTLLLGALTILTVGPALTMVKQGPLSRLQIPAGMIAANTIPASTVPARCSPTSHPDHAAAPPA